MTAILTALRWDDRPSEERFLLGECVSDHRHQCASSVCARERARQSPPGPAILVINLQITTFFFVAGLMLLERDEGTLNALAVSPPRPVTW